VRTGTQPHGVIALARAILHTHGPHGFFRGLGVSNAYIFPYIGINFAALDLMNPLLHHGPDNHVNREWLLAGSAFASFLGQTVAYPLDTLRRLMHITTPAVAPMLGVAASGAAASTSTSPSAWLLASNLYRRKGLQGFYAGLGCRALSVVPSTAISMVCFSELRNMLSTSEKNC
jgi:hypothetical protein